MPFFRSIEALKAECDFQDASSDGLDRMAETAKSAQSTGQVPTMPRLTEEELLKALTERVQMLEEELLARAPMTIALHGRVDALEAKADDGQRVIELIKAEFDRQGFNN